MGAAAANATLDGVPITHLGDTIGADAADAACAYALVQLIEHL